MQEKSGRGSSGKEERVGSRRWLYYLLGGWLLGLALSAGLFFYAEPVAREESAEEAGSLLSRCKALAVVRLCGDVVSRWCSRLCALSWVERR